VKTLHLIISNIDNHVALKPTFKFSYEKKTERK